MIENFWRDLSIGQVITLIVGIIGLLNLWFSGRAARGANAARNAIRNLLHVVGQPKDRVVQITLMQELGALTEELGEFKDAYKTNQDNILGQLRVVQARLGKDNGEPPIRDSFENSLEAGRNRY